MININWKDFLFIYLFSRRWAKKSLYVSWRCMLLLKLNILWAIENSTRRYNLLRFTQFSSFGIAQFAILQSKMMKSRFFCYSYALPSPSTSLPPLVLFPSFFLNWNDTISMIYEFIRFLFVPKEQIKNKKGRRAVMAKGW